MIALIVTLITSLLEILDQVFGSELIGHVEAVEIFLAAITPLLVWLLPNFAWKRTRWPDHGA